MLLFLFFIIIILVLITICVFLATYAFTNNIRATMYVFKNSFTLDFNKKAQELAISTTTNYLNDYFNKVAIEIVETRDKDLSEKLNLNKEEVNNFKNKMNQLIKNKDIVYISEMAVKRAAQRNKTFNFFNLLATNTQAYSSDKVILLENLKKNFKNGNLTKRECTKILKTYKIPPKKARIYLTRKRKKSKNISEYILPFVQKLINRNDNIKTMYDYSIRV